MLMTFAQNLKYVMERDNLSMYRVSKLTGFSQTTVKNWLLGRTEPYKKDWDKIATALSVSVSDLFPISETKKDLPLGLSSKPVDFDVDRILANYDDGLTDSQRDLISLIYELPDDVVLMLLSAAKEWLKNHKSADSDE